jgi:hypothetical protein
MKHYIVCTSSVDYTNFISFCPFLIFVLLRRQMLYTHESETVSFYFISPSSRSWGGGVDVMKPMSQLLPNMRARCVVKGGRHMPYTACTTVQVLVAWGRLIYRHCRVLLYYHTKNDHTEEIVIYPEAECCSIYGNVPTEIQSSLSPPHSLSLTHTQTVTHFEFLSLGRKMLVFKFKLIAGRETSEILEETKLENNIHYKYYCYVLSRN